MRPFLALCFLTATLWLGDGVHAADEGRIVINTVDKATGQSLAARMHLKDSRGKVIRPPKVPFWKDHFVFDGSIMLDLPPGMYTGEVECGPEYKFRIEQFKLDRDSNDTKSLEMERFVDMKKDGWWSGDLHIHRPQADIELLMRAEDLHIGPVITWWNNRSEWQGKKLPEKPLVQFPEDLDSSSVAPANDTSMRRIDPNEDFDAIPAPEDRMP